MLEQSATATATAVEAEQGGRTPTKRALAVYAARHGAPFTCGVASRNTHSTHIVNAFHFSLHEVVIVALIAVYVRMCVKGYHATLLVNAC